MTLNHHLRAFNTAKDSENRMHDDTVAQRYGFVGGLVPGVEVYAYMTHLAVAQWGPDWFDRGWLSARFNQPVYDGDETHISGTLDADEQMIIDVRVGDKICATGRAGLNAETAVRRLSNMPEKPLPKADARPAASFETLPEGMVLGTVGFACTPAALSDYRAWVSDDLALYQTDRHVHPGLVLRLANAALKDNVMLGPWIHVGSTVQHFAPAWVGDQLQARAQVAGSYEKRGHRFVELDVAVGNAAGLVAEIRHTAIFEPRQTAAD